MSDHYVVIWFERQVSRPSAYTDPHADYRPVATPLTSITGAALLPEDFIETDDALADFLSTRPVGQHALVAEASVRSVLGWDTVRRG